MGWGGVSLLASFTALAACGGGEFSAKDDETAGSAGAAGSAETVGTGGAGTTETVSTVASGNTTDTSTSSGAGGNASSQGGAAGATSASGGVGGQAGTGATTTTGGTADAGGPRDASSFDTSTRDAVIDGVIDGPIATKCPPTEPNASGYCADGLDCTYGSHPKPLCRKDYLCSGSHWIVSPSMTCPDPPKCENEAPFPLVGGPCAPAEHDCLAASGLYCRCHAAPTNPAPTWDCYPSPTGCPTTPPNKGQLCDLTAKTCDYGTCSIGSRVTTSCSGSIVHWSIACP